MKPDRKKEIFSVMKYIYKIKYVMKKRNPIAEDLRSPKYKKRIVKPKKGKGSFKRKKIV